MIFDTFYRKTTLYYEMLVVNRVRFSYSIKPGFNRQTKSVHSITTIIIVHLDY